MPDKNSFISKLTDSYQFKGESILLGSAVYKDDHAIGFQVKIPLRTLNRHGLIAGATGTGKTVTLQILAEAYSRIGVPVFLADIKGDLSGIALPGQPNDKIAERIQQIGIDGFQHRGNPVVFWDVFGKNGHPVRTTISDMGPLLLSNLLELNDTQSGPQQQGQSLQGISCLPSPVYSGRG